MNYLAGFTLLLIAILVMVAQLKKHVPNPEELILGNWTEKAWQYEKVSNPNELHRKHSVDTMAQSVKDQLGKHLIIHSAETWHFNSHGKLLLRGADTVKMVNWKVKGRGHILELEYANQVIEHYNITELTSTRLVLNFDSDIQVKGIAKLTFDNLDRVTQIQQ
ncbi:MAG: hypothetical protein KF856_07015 [Cyclobacteriaceae bacterium]|nr:hypothetical protein [Cyclobacteriaceae bacterium]